ncbi:MAG: D-alanyl-D-alanine carboxypeptidase/D-alanyl-D-alanine-endopeptidase [candidate division WOR-3 bacterium]|jgi:PBP4 family serine-type D-alanyl-D-alanine carboxypeptidase
MILLLLASLSLDSIINQPELQHVQVGMIVIDLERDSVVYARECRRNLVPASNVKIVTSAAALTFLGRDFRFKTRLGLSGRRQRNKWDGDVIVVGGGDPSFGLEDLEHFVTTLKDQGIASIAGNLILDDGYFTDERLPIGWAWHYLDARYAAEISALSLNRNVVNVHIRATTPGEPANVSIEPPTRYVRLVNSMRTRASDDSIIIFRRPEANTIYVDGGIGFGRVRDIEVAVKDPTMFFGEYLKERLFANGIKIRGSCIKNRGSNVPARSAAFEMIDSVVSVPMFEIIQELNTESVNLYGEAVLKTLGAYYGKEGSFRAGVAIIKEFMRRCGVDTALVALHDGSGLSRHNLVSPYDIALVLRYMYHSELSNEFSGLLPGPGEGTLEKKFNGLTGILRAKTGTLDGVSCLSGYLRFDDRDYCFSMLFNNFTCANREIEEIQEEILEAIKRSLEEEAS